MNDELCWFDPIIETTPEHLAGSDSWSGHIPLAFFLIAALKPKQLVELGVFAGNSLFAFAQAARKIGHDIQISGIDAWESDPHSGGYDGGSVYQLVLDQQKRYPDVVTLHKSFFDEVRPNFAPGSIDVLHIDGYHHYDAVTHDFVTWCDAVAEYGVVLFHDISVRRDDFGVWRFWEELKAKYGAEQTLEFEHSNGLGVLLLAPLDRYPRRFAAFCNAYQKAPGAVRAIFRMAGERVQMQFSAKENERLANESRFRLEQDVSNWQQECQRLQEQLQKIYKSRSWKLTAPLRMTRRKLGS